MHRVGIQELKDRLREYVRLAAGGETVLVTDRGRVVAELVAPQAGRAEVLADARLAEAVRRGWIRPALRRSTTPPPRQPVAPLAEILAGLEDDRGGR